MVLTWTALARAQDAGDEQQRLYDRMVRQPTNYDVTYAYVKVATERGDFEAAIGALERLLYYNPDLPAVKAELGTLYYRLRAHEMAKRYFREALASPSLDAATKAKIEASLSTVDHQSQQSRFAGFAQTGLRYQTNASLAPAGSIRIGGQDFGLSPTTRRQSDGNWFGLVGLSHDYDLQNERRDTLETRFLGYATRQFRLHDLDVAIMDGNFGIRTPLPSGLLPGASIKPYLAGGNTWVGGSQYLTALGAGVTLSLPVAPRVNVDPSFEWRHVDFTTNDPDLSEFGSGDWFTAGLSMTVAIADPVRLDMRGSYRRGEATRSYQDFNQGVIEAALSFQFAPPFASIPRNWTISPFGRVVRTEFDAPNALIDPAVARADTLWVGGIIFDTPITQTYGVSTTVQYDRTFSTLPNFRQYNLSVLSGITARF